MTDGYSWPDDMRSSAFMAFRGADDEDNWDDLNPFNRLVGEDNQHTLFQQTKNVAHTDGDRLYGKQTSLDQVGAEGGYLICARDSKWTKQYWKTLFNNATVQRGKADYVIPGSSNNTEGVGTVGVVLAGVSVRSIRVGVRLSSLRRGEHGAERGDEVLVVVREIVPGTIGDDDFRRGAEDI